MKKKMFIMLAMLLTIGSMAACSKKEKEPEPAVVEETEEPAPEPVEEEPEEVIPENQNLLTGLPDLTEEAIGKRPVAVMVNNIPDAMPQYGVEQADIIFHIKGITCWNCLCRLYNCSQDMFDPELPRLFPGNLPGI